MGSFAVLPHHLGVQGLGLGFLLDFRLLVLLQHPYSLRIQSLNPKPRDLNPLHLGRCDLRDYGMVKLPCAVAWCYVKEFWISSF